MPRILENWLEAYLHLDHESESPALYREWTGLFTIAAAAQRKIYLSMNGSNVYPCMYMVLVGPPSCRKGTSLWLARKLLNELKITLAPDSSTAAQIIEEIEQAKKKTLIPGTNAQFITHSSLSFLSAELAVFLQQNDQRMYGYLCDWFDSPDTWKYKTKHSGNNLLPGIALNFLGATTPSQVPHLFPEEQIGSGLVSRFIFVCARSKEKAVALQSFTSSKEGKALYQDLLNDLKIIYSMAGQVKITDSFFRLYVPWYEGMDYSKAPFGRGKFDHYWARRATHLRKMAICMALSRRQLDGRKRPDGTTKMSVTGEDFESALDLLERTEYYMPIAFECSGDTETADIVNKLLPFIKGKTKERGYATVQEIKRCFIRDIPPDKFIPYLTALANAKYIKVVGKKKVVYIGDKDDI